MRWQDRRASTRVEDRRGMGGIPGGRPVGLGCGGLLLVIVVTMLLGGDPMQILQILGGMEAATVDQPAPGEPDGRRHRRALRRAGPLRRGRARRYRGHLEGALPAEGRHLPGAQPGPVLGHGGVGLRLQLGGGGTVLLPARSAGLHRPLVLRRPRAALRRARRLRAGLRHRARGRASRAEPARHLGAGAAAASRRRRRSPKSTPGRCGSSYRPTASPGVWGHHASRDGLLEPGDLEEGMQRRRRDRRRSAAGAGAGRIVPESFTHGSSEQRVSWFARGAEAGDPDACSTFE